MPHNDKKKKKKQNSVRKFILNKTGATAVIQGLESGRSKDVKYVPKTGLRDRSLSSMQSQLKQQQKKKKKKR